MEPSGYRTCCIRHLLHILYFPKKDSERPPEQYLDPENRVSPVTGIRQIRAFVRLLQYLPYSIKSVKSDGVPSRKTVEQLFREYIKLSDRLGMGYRLSDMNSDIDVEPAADVFIQVL